MGTHPIFESDFDCLTESAKNNMSDEISEKELAEMKIEDGDEESNYKAPAKKTIDELNKLDAEDESLRKYKEALLGGGGTGGEGPRVVVKKIELHCDDLKQPLVLDLTQSAEELQKQSFTIKEGSEYQLHFFFKVNNEILSGLRYSMVVKRKGIPVDKSNVMVGSYAPQYKDHSFRTEPEVAPAGMLARGHYKVKSKFIDDDKEEHACWEWAIDIAKDWAKK